MRADPRHRARIVAWRANMSAGREVYSKHTRVSTSSVRYTPRDRHGPAATSHTKLLKDCFSLNQVEVVDAFVEPGVHRI